MVDNPNSFEMPCCWRQQLHGKQFDAQPIKTVLNMFVLIHHHASLLISNFVHVVSNRMPQLAANSPLTAKIYQTIFKQEYRQQRCSLLSHAVPYYRSTRVNLNTWKIEFI
jgi:hypothetical protein